MRNFAKGFFLIFIMLNLFIQPAWSYFSDVVYSETVFDAVDSISLQVIEDRWNDLHKDEAGVPQAAAHLVSKQVVEKNPCVKNISPIDIWALLSVCIPKEKVALVDDITQTVLYPKKTTELFSFVLPEGSGWIEVPELEDFTSDEVNRYVFMYSEPLCPDECSTPIFEFVRLNNLLAGSTEGVKDVSVEAYGIQKKGFDTAEDALSFFLSKDIRQVAHDA